jgi:Zn-dependent peptidase ImmA (M78 family)
MLELHSKKDIEKISLEILRDSKSLDVFPTPIDRVIQYSELIVRHDIDVSQIHTDYFFKASNALKRAVSKVRGMLDRTEKTIYLDLSQKTERKNFVKLHEVGHSVLPWQSDIHDVIDDDDESLNSDYHEEFEAEANYFASITLFQHDRFNDELSKLPLGIESSMQLAKQFGASIHATLRRYVQCSKKRCALLVLENIAEKGKKPLCNIRNSFYSNKFDKTFGTFIIPDKMGFTWAFVQDYYFKKRFKLDGNISIPTLNGNADFNYHYFFNGYNAFVFLFPVDEIQPSRTKIIVSETNI